MVYSNAENALMLVMCIILAWSAPSSAQQKGQWVPGQAGLDAGILPSPGFTYANLTINYSAGTLKGPEGNSIPCPLSKLNTVRLFEQKGASVKQRSRIRIP